MDLQAVKQSLESTGESLSASVDSLPGRFFDSFILHGLKIDTIEPGRVICSFKVPQRLVNTGNFLHGGATASLVDIVGSAALMAAGALTSGVSVEINISYLDAAFLGEGVEIEANVLRMGKAIGVVNVDLRKKKTALFLHDLLLFLWVF
ncbi:acyl-coenzyme A thioesterase 13 isoform X2 [Amborella trichopoda]|uniref:acyl-coenzyme A thioesterase 13 isoform X2 n=1 Tax=Amborella trichopoda TaxID=13333 RepID=UPI0005D37619|nr:acyl-coenzyme A thioesterase 13 isoform X2 [Amborella trichopoda]XP_020527196.1 acyl-coenzyme A thioesterase 13 isoform X2 [Amborella trichopoda]|eukprot:XP_011625895.1 acyl-coenzyme A thioesterase 13 isoform X2 [Amborella trichopoda]